MHPYRTEVFSIPKAPIAERTGVALAFAVLTAVSAIQVASGLGRPLEAQTVVGGVCLIAGIAGLGIFRSRSNQRSSWSISNS